MFWEESLKAPWIIDASTRKVVETVKTVGRNCFTTVVSPSLLYTRPRLPGCSIGYDYQVGENVPLTGYILYAGCDIISVHAIPSYRYVSLQCIVKLSIAHGTGHGDLIKGRLKTPAIPLPFCLLPSEVITSIIDIACCHGKAAPLDQMRTEWYVANKILSTRPPVASQKCWDASGFSSDGIIYPSHSPGANSPTPQVNVLPCWQEPAHLLRLRSDIQSDFLSYEIPSPSLAHDEPTTPPSDAVPANV